MSPPGLISGGVSRWTHSAKQNLAFANDWTRRRDQIQPRRTNNDENRSEQCSPISAAVTSCSCRCLAPNNNKNIEWLCRTLQRVSDDLASLKASILHSEKDMDNEMCKRLDEEYNKFLLAEQSQYEQYPLRHLDPPYGQPQTPQVLTRTQQAPTRPPLRRAQVREVPGNLFEDAPAGSALGHCVGADFRMGAGIAVEFRERFGHHEYLKSQNSRPGQVVTVPLYKQNEDFDRYIFHIVTKPRSANCLPREEEFIPAVRQLANLCTTLGVRTLAIPQIGAGLDRQPWPWARSIIEQEFAGVDTQVLVFAHPSEYPKNECRQPSYNQVAAGTHKPWGNHQRAPPPQLPPRQPPPKQSAKIPVTDRLIADMSKKDGAKSPRAEQPDHDGTSPPPTPMDVPGRDGASKAVKATVTAQEGGAVCSKEACELTGALTSSALSPASEPSGEPPSTLPPPAAIENANGGHDSAPEMNTISRTLDQTTHKTTPSRTEMTESETFETPTATAQSGLISQTETSPEESILNFKPTEYASQVSKHIRALTYGNKPTTVPTDLINIMTKNTTQNITHTVN
jgi:O-acetyl-ADP-ribose deacetylase (regulator of RNase III)